MISNWNSWGQLYTQMYNCKHTTFSAGHMNQTVEWLLVCLSQNGQDGYRTSTVCTYQLLTKTSMKTGITA